MRRRFVFLGTGLWVCLLAAVPRGQYAAPRIANAPTFNKDVAPILYKNCTTCHRPGEIAPMSLLSYKDARPWAKAIREEVSLGHMPPWHADPAHGTFLNDRRLSDENKDTVIKWVNGGAPEGNAADLPPQPTYADGWAMGQPDAVIAMSEDYPVPADGMVEYKYFEVPTHFTADKWVQAMEVRPGNRSVVHHALVFIKTPQPALAPQPATFKFAPGMEEPKNPDVEARKRAPFNDRPIPDRLGSLLSVYVPGQSTRVYEPGQAIRIPAGAVLLFQMHYSTTGALASDRTRIGFKYAKEPPKQEVLISSVSNRNFTIPAGDANHRIDAELTVQCDITIWSLTPHTHVRGKRWEYQATYPDGRTETILGVPKYDFNWQTEYIFKQPLKLPKGTRIRATAWYDNSPNNKSNPDPSSEVHWGDQTWEEMQFSFIAYTIDPVATSSSGK
jgi:hypothetical protein